MNAAEHAEVLVTARLLRAAGRVDWLGTGMTLLGVAGVFLSQGNVPLMIISIVLGLAAKLYFVRIVFDARLFEDVAARRMETAELDEALSSIGGKKAGSGERPWPDRCQGARRLIVIGSILTIAQCAALLSGLLVLR